MTAIRKLRRLAVLRTAATVGAAALLGGLIFVLSATHQNVDVPKSNGLSGQLVSNSLPATQAENIPVMQLPSPVSSMEKDKLPFPAKPIRPRQKQIVDTESPMSLSDFWIAFRQQLRIGIKDGFASSEIERLLDRFVTAKIPVADKQSMLWSLRSEIADLNARMAIYDMIDRIDSETIVSQIVAEFSNIDSPVEQARVLDLLNRSLMVSDTDLASADRRTLLENNTREIVGLLEDQISKGEQGQPSFQKAVDLLPNLLPSDRVVEIYDSLWEAGKISSDVYFDGMSRVVLSDQESMIHDAPELLGQLALEDEHVRAAINPKVYDYIRVTSSDGSAIPEEIKQYVASQRPSEYSPNQGDYVMWSIGYFDWLQAMKTVGNTDTNTNYKPIEVALVSVYQPNTISALDQGELLSLDTQLRGALNALPSDSPHRSLFDQAISAVDEQLKWSASK